jgi:PleD family two-component response regulator
VFLTADGTADNIYVAMNNRISDFIVKPIDRDILRKKLDGQLKDFMLHRRMRVIN